MSKIYPREKWIEYLGKYFPCEKNSIDFLKSLANEMPYYIRTGKNLVSGTVSSLIQNKSAEIEIEEFITYHRENPDEADNLSNVLNVLFPGFPANRYAHMSLISTVRQKEKTVKDYISYCRLKGIPDKFQHLSWGLRKYLNYYPVWNNIIILDGDRTKGVADNCREFKSIMKKVLDSTGFNKINLIGHSIGAIYSIYLGIDPDFQESIANIINTGPIWKGAADSTLISESLEKFPFDLNAILNTLGVSKEFFHDLSFHSSFSQELGSRIKYWDNKEFPGYIFTIYSTKDVYINPDSIEDLFVSPGGYFVEQFLVLQDMGPDYHGHMAMVEHPFVLMIIQDIITGRLDSYLMDKNLKRKNLLPEHINELYRDYIF